MKKWCWSLFLALLLALSGWQTASAATLVDQDGNKLVYEVPFSRIISLYPAHTENLLALGLEQELIGVSVSDDPAAARGRMQFGTRDNAEKFIAAKPDLVLIRPMISRAHPQLLSQLQEAGITIVSLQPTSIEEMFSYWRTLGEISGRNSEAASMILTFQRELAVLQQRRDKVPVADRPKVYFEAIHAAMKTFAPTSMAIFVLENGGGVNVAADAVARNSTNIADYGKERILSHAAEIDVYLAQQGRMNRVTRGMIEGEPGYQAIKAIQDERIYFIDEELVSRPTMRLLQGIRQVSKLLYPEG